MAENIDWQLKYTTLRKRTKFLLQSGQWADCTFKVGSSHQLFQAHKFILSMASPVFERMFHGSIPEHDSPIVIQDVNEESFKAFLDYIYIDRVVITSHVDACNLCYVAKKYMMPHLEEKCVDYLCSNLDPDNFFNVYECAKLFEKSSLVDTCIEFMRTSTKALLQHKSLEIANIETVATLFSQDMLAINSEIELFDAAMRYYVAQEKILMFRKNSPHTDAESKKRKFTEMSEEPSEDSKISNENSIQKDILNDINAKEDETSNEYGSKIIIIKDDKPNDIISKDDGPNYVSTKKDELDNIIRKYGELNDKNNTMEDELQAEEKAVMTISKNVKIKIRSLVEKIRFLTLSSMQFASGPARSPLLTKEESYALLMNIVMVDCGIPLPDGLSKSRNHRQKLDVSSMFGNELPAQLEENSRFYSYLYCRRSLTREEERINEEVMNCSVTLTVDKTIIVHGVQIPTQVPKCEPPATKDMTYPERVYAELQDADGARITYAHYSKRVFYSSVQDIIFNRPVYLRKNKTYKIMVEYYKIGWYSVGPGSLYGCSNCVYFNFNIGPHRDCVRDGVIRSIIFSLCPIEDRSVPRIC